MLTIDRNSSEPIYLQLRGHLIDKIRTNQLQPGGRLPSICELSRQLGVAPLTVWDAVKTLAGEGILLSNGGRGGRFSLERLCARYLASCGRAQAPHPPRL